MSSELQPGEATARQARAEQILAAAGELLLRYGYGRITMEDVAGQAGVGTGTIYLHWKTKEALFETVLLRELLAIWAGLGQRLDADYTEALLHRFLSSLLRAVKQRPLASALFTRNSTLLGKLAQSSVVQQSQQLTSAAQLMALLRELGLVRSDISLEVQAHAFSAIWAGFSLVDPLLPSSDRVSVEAQVAALTHTIRCTFEPDTLPQDEVLRSDVAPRLRATLAQAQAAFAQQIQMRMLGVAANRNARS